MRAVVALVTLVLLLPLAIGESTELSVADRLAAAQKEGRVVFLVVTEPTTRKAAAMRAVANEAQRQTPRSVVVEMDRSRKQNRPTVKRYGLAGAPLPITLIIAHNGAPAGGVAQKGDALGRLLSLIPTPRKAETLLALFERKAVFVVVARPGMADEASVLSACRDAIASLRGKRKRDRAAIVRVNLDDKAERAFLDLLGADRKATQVVTHVYGLSGKKTGVLKGVPKAGDLVRTATKKAECCPGGKCG